MARAAALNVVIVGGGISGLAAALSLRRAGHTVHIYERSSLNNEIGAAIHLAPNASRALLAWGLDPVRAKFVVCKCSFRAKGDTLEKFHVGTEDYIEEKYGAPWFLCHRVDLHDELKRLATGPEGLGKPAEVHLKSGVVKYVSNHVTSFRCVSCCLGSLLYGGRVIPARQARTELGGYQWIPSALHRHWHI